MNNLECNEKLVGASLHIKNVKFTGSTEQLEKVVEILVGNGYTSLSYYPAWPSGAIVVYDHLAFKYINAGKQYDDHHSYPEQDIEEFITQHSDKMVKMCFRDSPEGKAAFKGLESAYDSPSHVVLEPHGDFWKDNDGTMPDLPEGTCVDVILRDNIELVDDIDVPAENLRWTLGGHKSDILKWRYHRPEDVEYYQQPKTANSFSIDYINSEGAPIMGYTYTKADDDAGYDIIDKEAPTRNKYMREIKPDVWVDCYDVIRAFGVTDPCLQHLLKKALAAGKRHHKDEHEDLKDVLASAKRALEIYEEWNK